MASSSGNSTGSTQIQNSGSEEDVMKGLMDQRKRKRMQSNRESARRSRQRKQKHLNDLMEMVGELRKENSHLHGGINATTQQFLSIEAENSVLKAQMMELSHRLEALDGIVKNMNANLNADHYHGGGRGVFDGPAAAEMEFPAAVAAGGADGFMEEPWMMNMLCFNQPIMASADTFQY